LTPLPIATDDARQAAEATEFWQKLDAMVVATTNAKKKYYVARARVLATTALLEEEEHATVVLTEEACTMAALIELPSPTPAPTLAGRATPSDDDYEAAVIANIHI
jgi:hypothetical protein